MSIEAMKQALEALEQLQGGCTDSEDGTVKTITVWSRDVIDVLRKALAQSEQEPVAMKFKIYKPTVSDSENGTVETITVWSPEVIDALRQAIEQAHGIKGEEC